MHFLVKNRKIIITSLNFVHRDVSHASLVETRKIDQKERKPIIGTDQSEEIIKKLSLKSFEGGYKIMIIWMAEEMNSTCSNKLLKIIEEPPEKTLFILISESSEKLLQTILSRTQIVLIPRINMEELRDHLVKNHSVTQQNPQVLYLEGLCF